MDKLSVVVLNSLSRPPDDILEILVTEDDQLLVGIEVKRGLDIMMSEGRSDSGPGISAVSKSMSDGGGGRLAAAVNNSATNG